MNFDEAYERWKASRRHAEAAPGFTDGVMQGILSPTHTFGIFTFLAPVDGTSCVTTVCRCANA